jgi:YggT family protein
MIYGLVNLYIMIVVLWCLLSWFPNIKWYEQPFKGLDAVVRPFLAPFRKIIPPISGIDLSPMVAILLLQVCGSVIRSFLP